MPQGRPRAGDVFQIEKNDVFFENPLTFPLVEAV